MKKFTIAFSILLAILSGRAAFAQTYTISPSPFLTALDNNGLKINNACIWTYVAGTTTPVATYSDNIGTANANPIRSDSAGRFTAFLSPGSSYKFVYESACTPPSHGTTLRTADNITAMPASAATVDVTGTAGEALSAGQVVYLSDGSASKTAGQWYKADSANAYSSTSPVVGMALSAISSAASGTIRLSGAVTGLSSLSVGAAAYVGTAGALTTTAPTLARLLGQADTASSFVLTAAPPRTPPLDISACEGRLTLTSGTPVTTADVTAATTLYFTPYRGNRCAFYDGANWSRRPFTELSIAIPASTSVNYDAWIVDTAGVLSLELTAWTNDTTRATALALQDGVTVKSGAATRRYLGTCRTTTVSGQTEDSATKRYVWNYANRVRRPLLKDGSGSWTYATATWRQANAAAANQVDVVVGVAEVTLSLSLDVLWSNTNTGSTVFGSVGIGEDSTSALVAGQHNITVNAATANDINQLHAVLTKMPAVGRHVYAWLEYSAAVGTSTFYGSSVTSTLGLGGWIEG